MMDILNSAITALATVVLTLAAVLKLYLPHHDRKLQNPWAERLLEELHLIREDNIKHRTWEKATLEEVRRGLERIEGRLLLGR